MKRKGNKESRPPSGKPSMHVPQIGRRTVLEGLGDDLAQALGRKGVIRQAGQREPFETDLPAVTLPPLPDGRKVGTQAMEDGFDLVEMAMDPVHRVVLADILAQVQQPLRHHLQAQFLQDLPSHGVAQGLAMVLASARQYQELAFLGADPDRQDVFAAQDDGTGRRPDPGGSTA